jgi:hypothetical protein
LLRRVNSGGRWADLQALLLLGQRRIGYKRYGSNREEKKSWQCKVL